MSAAPTEPTKLRIGVPSASALAAASPDCAASHDALLNQLAQQRPKLCTERVCTIVHHPDTSDSPPVLLFPLQEAYTLPQIYAASKHGTDLSAIAFGRDQTLLGLFSGSSRLHCSVAAVVLTSAYTYEPDSPDAGYTQQTIRLQCASRALLGQGSFLDYAIAHNKKQVKVPAVRDDNPDEWTGGYLVLETGNKEVVYHTGNEYHGVTGVLNQVYFRLVLCVTSPSNPLLEAWRAHCESAGAAS